MPDYSAGNSAGKKNLMLEVKNHTLPYHLATGMFNSTTLLCRVQWGVVNPSVENIIKNHSQIM